MKRVFLLTALLLITGFQARGESSFLACQDPSRSNAPIIESELATKLLQKKLLYLSKNRRITEDIIRCLELSPSWKTPTPAGCQKFEYLLGNELLSKNFAFRMSQALSQRSLVMEPGRVQNLFDFEAQVDLELSRSSGMGVLDGQQPLIPGERDYVYRAYVEFWRQFTQDYMAEMKERMNDPRLSKYQKRDYERRLDLLQKALDSADPEFLQRLSWSGDANFNAAAEYSYSNFRQNHRMAWMEYLEGMRVIAFVKKAEPSPQDLRVAFQNFLDNGKETAAGLTVQLTRHKRGEDSVDTGELLSGDLMLSEEVLAENPSLCSLAENEIARYRHNQFIKTVFIGIPLSIGILGAAFFAPPIISIPMMVAVDVYWISTSQIEMREQRRLFYSTLSARNQVGTLNNLEDAEGNSFLATALAPLTLTAIHPAASMKVLVRAVKAKF